jgi:regulator of sigma E protease
LGGYVKLLDGRDREQMIPAEERPQSFDVKPLWQRSMIVAAGPFANFLLAVILFSVIYVSGVPQLPARLQAPPEQSIAAKLGVAVGDEVIGWQSLSSDYNGGPILEEFESVPSWNALRWLLLDAITGEQGFALEIQDAAGARQVKSFRQGDLPPITPESDPFQALGLFPQVSPPSEWIELKLGPIDALAYAYQRVSLITKISFRLMLGLFTGKTTLKQLGGPLSIADMAGKSAQVGWQPFVAFLALMSISIGLLNLVPLPMLDGGQLLYDAWELVAGKRISLSLQEKLQKVGFLLLISLSLLALFNDLQRYLSP